MAAMPSAATTAATATATPGMPNIPEIVAGRFGLEQRCCYRHPDLYDEEVPEADLETVVARPDLGAACAVRSFLLLGDQNAGKSTMLHSFCRHGDASFMQLSSLLPILSSSFVNARFLPLHSLEDAGDLNAPLSKARDELPFMDTDIARGMVMLSLENFAFFCSEFGISDVDMDGSNGFNFTDDVRFVALQFVELGGDHLDRLATFASSNGDLTAVREAEGGDRGEDSQFWADMHEVLMGSMRLLQETQRTAYFVNCASLFPSSKFAPTAFRAMLRKLWFLAGVLNSSNRFVGKPEVLVYCSRINEVDMDTFDAEGNWAEALQECLAFVRDNMGASSAGALKKLLPTWIGLERTGGGGYAGSGNEGVGMGENEGLDLSALRDVSGSEASAKREAAEVKATPLLTFVRTMFVQLVMPALAGKLQLVGVFAVRNLLDPGEQTMQNSMQSVPGPVEGHLCVPSVVRNVALLLQRQLCQSSNASAQQQDGLHQHVAELILRCASTLRGVETESCTSSATIVGRWVSRSDLADHLEECEAEMAVVPLPEVSTWIGWEETAKRLLDSSVCCEAASNCSLGLPNLAFHIELDNIFQSPFGDFAAANPSDVGGGGGAADLWTLIIEPSEDILQTTGHPNDADNDDVIFVTSLSKRKSQYKGVTVDPIQAIGLPLHADFFKLLTSEAVMRGVSAHVGRATGYLSSSSSSSFALESDGAVRQLESIHQRLNSEVTGLIGQVLSIGTNAISIDVGTGLLSKLLNTASDLRQAQNLLRATRRGGIEEADFCDMPAAKRPRSEGASAATLQGIADNLGAIPGFSVRLVRGRPAGSTAEGANQPSPSLTMAEGRHGAAAIAGQPASSCRRRPVFAQRCSL